MSAEPSALQVRDDGPVRVLTMDRPERLNALSPGLVDDLHGAFQDVRAEPGCRVVVLTGAGRGFCAGLDLTGRGAPRSSTAQERMRTQQRISSMVPALRALPQPVVAAVNGPAAGGGLALALASDLRVLAESASLHIAFSGIGLSACDVGVSWLLPRLVGASVAFEMLLTARRVDAAEAHRTGLAGRVVPDAELMDTALALAHQVAAQAPMGLRMTKEVMWAQLEVSSLQAGIDLENRTQIMTTFTDDHTEAVRAFLDKRPPAFTDT